MDCGAARPLLCCIPQPESFMALTLPRRAALLAGASLLAVPGLAAPAFAQDAPIRIGEINSYTAQPAFLLPYRNAWNLAVEEVNAAGGINGRRSRPSSATMPAGRRMRCATPASC
jgi:hypothetical protein